MSHIMAKAVVPAAVLLLLIAGGGRAAPSDPGANLVFENDILGTWLVNNGTRTVFVQVRTDTYEEGDTLDHTGAPSGGGVAAGYIDPGARILVARNDWGYVNRCTITLAEYRAKPRARK